MLTLFLTQLLELLAAQRLEPLAEPRKTLSPREFVENLVVQPPPRSVARLVVLLVGVVEVQPAAVPRPRWMRFLIRDVDWEGARVS